MDKTKSTKRCRTAYCRNKCFHKTICSKCSMRIWRKANPIRDRYAIVKARAVKRDRVFDISYEDFLAICTAAEFNPKLHAIDRIDHTLGYTKDNIQILTQTENIIKGNIERSNCPF